MVAIGDDHSAANDLSPQEVSLFHRSTYCCVWLHRYIYCPPDDQLYRPLIIKNQYYTKVCLLKARNICALSCIFIRFISVSGQARQLHDCNWLQLIDIKTYLSSFFLTVHSSQNIIHTSDFQVYDIKPSYLLQVILCHRGIAHLIWNPSDTSSCSHSIKFSCDIIAISVLSYINIKYLFWYIYHHHTFPSRVLYDSWSAI